MTAYEKAHGIIAEMLDAKTATRVLDALMRKRLAVAPMRASYDMFTRYHAHMRYLAQEIGQTYDELYIEARDYALQRGEWPVKLSQIEIEFGGEVHIEDINVPQSSRLASTSNLTTAYQYIVDTAAEHKIVLPESVLHEGVGE